MIASIFVRFSWYCEISFLTPIVLTFVFCLEQAVESLEKLNSIGRSFVDSFRQSKHLVTFSMKIAHGVSELRKNSIQTREICSSVTHWDVKRWKEFWNVHRKLRKSVTPTIVKLSVYQWNKALHSCLYRCHKINPVLKYKTESVQNKILQKTRFVTL